jgi:hypothetical protein
MRAQPHTLIASFERRILRTLDFAFYAAALYYFWHRSWMFGIAILILSLGVGMIGQGLPHRKHETRSELATGNILAGGSEDEISEEDSSSLGRSLFKTCTLVCLTVAIILGHEGWRWYWIFLTVAAGWPISFCSFLALTVGPIRIVQNMRSMHRLY